MASAEPSPIEYLQILLSEEVLYTIQSYFEIKVIHEEGGNLFFFLCNRLHELFHYFVKQTPCCNATTPCAEIAIKGNLTKDQFFLLFDKNPSVQPTHEKIDKGRTLQHCICPLSPKLSTNVTDLDFTLINCLMKTCHKTLAGNPRWFKDILEVRNELSHLGDTSFISDQKMKDWWQKLENAALNIAGTIGVVHKNGVRRRISKIKTNQSQLVELMKTMQTRVDDLEQKILNTLENMGVNIDGVRFRFTTADFLQDEPKATSDSATSMFSTDPKKCTVVWKFSTPGDWNVKEMQKKLDCISIIGDFNVEFAYQGSLIVHTTTDRGIVSDVDVFKEAVEEFLLLFSKRLMIPVASGMGPVDVALSIWNHQTSKESDSTTHPAQAPVKQSQLPTKITLIKQIDTSGGLVTDCTFLDETFIISDYKNGRLIFCDANSDNVRYIPLSGKPSRISAVDSTTVAVGEWNGVIHIIDVTNSITIRHFTVKGFTGGLSNHHGHLYVGNYCKIIKVINLHGELIRRVKTESVPHYITVDNNNIFYTNNDNKLFCSSLTGENIWVYDMSMVKRISGLTTDEKGNIYFIGYGSHNVVVSTPDGKQVRQLLLESDALFSNIHARGICYNRKLKTLMVCNAIGPAILYKLEK